MSRKRKIIIILLVALSLLLIVIPFGLSAMIYEGNFGDRYETYEPMARSINEFEGLQSQRHTFTSNKGQVLVGYKYHKNADNPQGVVIISHGLGGGGHNRYMGVADHFASNGYIVFAYDATGNDESEGNSVKGLPQGLIDLDHAIQFVKESPEFADLPIMLFGHSWGGYSAGSALNIHPDVKAVVMVAGFDKTMDIIEEEGQKIAGDGIKALLPYISLYERIKLGKYASYSCTNGFENSEAGVMIIHSADDEMISPEKAFDVFYGPNKSNPRFKFVRYEDRGHDYVYHSDSSRRYINEFNSGFDEFLTSLDGEFTPEIRAAYLNDNLDKKLLYDLDDELMNSIVEFYNTNANR